MVFISCQQFVQFVHEKQVNKLFINVFYGLLTILFSEKKTVKSCLRFKASACNIRKDSFYRDYKGMTFFSKTVRAAAVFGVLCLGACSSADDSDLYGYEKDFVIPEPDMVPVTPDDKPGKTVDEMLALTTPDVTVKKATYEVEKDSRVYEHSGRFGSKEKISLRKGLNIPDSGILYGVQKRKNAEEVRPLEVKKQEKDEFQTVSEEEMLAQIIAPKTAAVEMIEVVPAQAEVNPVRSPSPVVTPMEPVDVSEIELKTMSIVAPEKEKPASAEKEIVLLTPPVVLREPAFAEQQVVLSEPAAKETVKLLPPKKEMILLLQPEQGGNPSVEVFLDE